MSGTGSPNSSADAAELDTDAEQRAMLLTLLVDEVYRLSGTLLAEGDALVASAGLTAARWRVLGQLAKEPATVAQLARRRGLRRQSVQESVERLERDGLVTRVPNNADRRAPLILLSEQGREALSRIEPVRMEWATKRSAAVNFEQMQATLTFLQQLRQTAPHQGG